MEQIEKKQHGGYRPGADRKFKCGVKTIVMRVTRRPGAGGAKSDRGRWS
jgi:hypothetical protein